MATIKESDLYRMMKIYSVVLSASLKLAVSQREKLTNDEYNIQVSTEALSKIREEYFENFFCSDKLAESVNFFQNDSQTDVQKAFWSLEVDEREALFLTIGSNLSAAGMAKLRSCAPGATEARAKAATIKLVGLLAEQSEARAKQYRPPANADPLEATRWLN